jgi:hypothetical protein
VPPEEDPTTRHPPMWSSGPRLGSPVEGAGYARAETTTRGRHERGLSPAVSHLANIILGFTAIRRGNVASDQAWMTRAYALALGAGTQVFTQGIGSALFGTNELTTDLGLGAGWAINLAVAEYVIRRRRNRRTIRATAEVGS